MIKKNIVLSEEIINSDNLYEFVCNTDLNKIESLNIPVSFNNDGIPLSYWSDNAWHYCKKRSIKNIHIEL